MDEDNGDAFAFNEFIFHLVDHKFLSEFGSAVSSCTRLTDLTMVGQWSLAQDSVLEDQSVPSVAHPTPTAPPSPPRLNLPYRDPWI